MSRKTEDRIMAAFALLLVLTILGAVFTFRSFAPCWFFKGSPAKNVPNRCIQVQVVVK